MQTLGTLAVFVLSLSTVQAAGFADGVKIGEVTDTSVVLWARLTKDREAGNRVDGWKPDAPNWTVPGEEGKIRFTYWKDGTEDDSISTDWTEVSAKDDFCHQVMIRNLSPATAYGFETNAKTATG